MFKVNKKILQRRRFRSGIFIVNFEHVIAYLGEGQFRKCTLKICFYSLSLKECSLFSEFTLTLPAPIPDKEKKLI